jgi:hypothetical protein
MATTPDEFMIAAHLAVAIITVQPARYSRDDEEEAARKAVKVFDACQRALKSLVRTKTEPISEAVYAFRAIESA